MPRQYNTLGRRILAVLAEGGPRKHSVLEGLAGSAERLKPVIDRLIDSGSIVRRRRQGGIHYALVPKRT